MNQLTFIRTMSVSAFKTLVGATSIDIIESPKTGKLFFTSDNCITGAVSNVEGDVCVSSVRGDDGTEFYLIQAKSEGNVKRTL